MSLLRAVGIPPELHKIVSVQLGADVVETLQNKAREELELLDIDVVVIGSHGYGGLDRDNRLAMPPALFHTIANDEKQLMIKELQK
jgi:nucleotide-binding universal stress UspA family protein